MVEDAEQNFSELIICGSLLQFALQNVKEVSVEALWAQ